MNEDVKTVTWNMVQYQVAKTYGFLEIALNSSQEATPQHLSPPFNYSVYPSYL
jgi:hypothetical protein